MDSEVLFAFPERKLNDGAFCLRSLKRSDFKKGFPAVLTDLTTVDVDEPLFLSTFDILVFIIS